MSVAPSGEVFAVAALVGLMWAVAPVAETQPPIRIGATPAQTGAFATLGQSNLPYQKLLFQCRTERG